MGYRVYHLGCVPFEIVNLYVASLYCEEVVKHLQILLIAVSLAHLATATTLSNFHLFITIKHLPLRCLI